MPFFQVADAPAAARPWDPGLAARLHSSAQHPAARGPAPRVVNLQTPYMALEAPEGAEWPRATLRPTPLLGGPGHGCAAKIWEAPDVPTKSNGTWVTKTSRDLGAAMDWAASEVARRRPKDSPGRGLEAPC